MSIRKKTSIKSHIVSLKDYNVINEINRGGFGSISLIERKEDGRRFAAKVNFQQDQSISIESKFISREIGILMRVEAPTIIQFCGFSLEDFNENPNVTILMEYYQNGSLRQLIEKEQKSSSPHEYDNTAKQIILCGIAHGMMTLHSRRVLHRDLKPDNILLDEDYHPHITDFGLSKFLDPTNSKSQSMAGCGTAPYIAPEVLEDTHYSTKSDVYSFGILMFEVLTGELAFSELFKKKRLTPFQITSRVLEGERPTFKGPIKPSFKKLIEQCWSQDPKARPTFRELFHKLSLSTEEDDDTIESTLQDMFCGGGEEVEFEYLLDGADIDQLLDYVYEITSERTKKEEELEQLVEKQAKRIQALEEQAKHTQSPEEQTKLVQIIDEQTKRIRTLEEQTKRIHLIEEQAKRIQALEEQTKHIQSPEEQSKLVQIIDEQTKRIQAIEERYQTEINQLKAENKRQIDQLESENKLCYQEIKALKAQLYEMPRPSFRPVSTSKPKPDPWPQPSFRPKVTSPPASRNVDPLNPLEGLTIPQMKKTINQRRLTYAAIPSTVTVISNYAFSECTLLEKVIIPSSVKSIGKDAFSKCSKLEQITIPSSVTSIGDYAFSECTSLKHIAIPSSVTSIGRKLFSGCTSLIEIVIPSSVTTIENEAFSFCISLVRIIIPSSVTTIGESAFYECASLKHITIPSSVTSIGNGAFSGCSQLEFFTKAKLQRQYGKQIF